MDDVAGRVRVRVVVNNFPQVRGRIADNAEAYVAKAAMDIEAHAKANIRAWGLIDTGNLHNSVRAFQLGPMWWRIEVGAHYGIYHELGTRYMQARPFLLPAAEAVQPSFSRAMAGLLS